jgi:hypothetical protein
MVVFKVHQGPFLLNGIYAETVSITNAGVTFAVAGGKCYFESCLVPFCHCVGMFLLCFLLSLPVDAKHQSREPDEMAKLIDSP